MAYYDFRCKKCKLDWHVEAPMSEAPDRDDCPKCGASCEQHFSEPTLIFKGDCYTNRRKRYNMVHNDKELAKKTQEELVDITKRRMDDQKSPYKNIGLKRDWVDKAVASGQWEKKRKP